MTSRVLRRFTLLPLAFVAFAACSDDDGPGPENGSFTLGNPAGTATVQAGATTTLSIPTTRTGTLSTPVTLSASDVPGGIQVSFNPSVVQAGNDEASIIVRVADTVSAGTRSFTVKASAPGMQDQTKTVNIDVTPRPGYTVSIQTDGTNAAKDSISAFVGTTRTIQVTLNRQNGFTGPVELLFDALPVGVTAQSVTTAGNTATITLNVATTSPERTGTFTLRAMQAGMVDRTINVPIQILRPQATSISTATATVTAQQNTRPTTQFTLIREGLYDQNVVITLEGLPAGVTAAPVTVTKGSLSVASVPWSQTVTIPLVIAPDAVIANGTVVTARLTSPGLPDRTSTMTLNVASIGTDPRLARDTALVIPSTAANGLRVYRVDVPANASNLVVRTSGGTGDFDIVGVFRTRTSTTGPQGPLCSSGAAGNTETCTVPNADLRASASYYVIVLAYSASANANISATWTLPGEPGHE